MNRKEKFFTELKPLAYLLNKSKGWRLPGFERVPLYDVLRFFYQQNKKIGLNTRAAAISFNILMALPAALIFLCTLVPYLPKAIHFEKQLLITLREIIKDFKTYRLLADIIHDFFTTQRSGLLSTSFLAAIFFSSNAMMGVLRTFDRSFYEQRKGRFLARRWTAIRLTTLLVVLVFVAVLTLATEGSVKTFFLKQLHMNRPAVKSIIESTRWVVILLLDFFTIAFIYRLAPAIKNRWRLFSPGALLASFLTIFTSALFSEWVSHFGRFNKVYGSIGTVLIIMNLVFLNSLILIIGFELNVSITSVKNMERMNAGNEDETKQRLDQ